MHGVMRINFGRISFVFYPSLNAAENRTRNWGWLELLDLLPRSRSQSTSGDVAA